MSPLFPLSCAHLSSLRAWLSHWPPLTLVALKWKMEVTPGFSAGPAFYIRRDSSRISAFHSGCHQQGSFLVLFFFF